MQVTDFWADFDVPTRSESLKVHKNPQESVAEGPQNSVFKTNKIICGAVLSLTEH